MKNKELKEKVELLKSQLKAAEIANGVIQVRKHTFLILIVWPNVCILNLVQLTNELNISGYKWCTTGVSKLQPVGEMRAAKPFHLACEAVLSMMKKI